MSVKTKSKPGRIKAASAPPRPITKQSRISAVAPLPAIVHPSQPAHRVRVYVSLSVLLALTTFAVYFRSISNPFVNFDDQAYVVENAQIQQGLTVQTVKWAFTSAYASNWHPLTWLSHALDFRLFGLNPAGHHFTSLLLHIFNVVLLFLILAGATGATKRSLLVAAIFALHPINVESVAWVAERKNVLSMFFLLLTIGAYGWYSKHPNVWRYLAPFFLFAMALAAKPMVITLPLLLLLVDFWPLQRVRGVNPPSPAFPVPQFSFWRLAMEKLPLLLLSAGSAILTIIAQRSVISSNEHLPAAVRLANAAYSYSMYIVKTLWPLHLAAFYPYEGIRIPGWQVALLFLLLAGVSVLIWRERPHTYLPVGWLWFLGSLVPMSGLVMQVGDQTMADRYAYLPLIGIFCIIVWGGVEIVDARRWNDRTAMAVAGFVLIVLSVMTWRQIGVWNSSYELWSHALRNTRDNYMAEDYVGTSLLVQNYEATGQRYSAEATIHFTNAARINPQDAISHLNLGADFHEHGRLREAAQQYEAALRLTRDPHLLEKTLIDLGAVAQQMEDFDRGRKLYLEVLKMDPGNEVAFDNLGKLEMDEQIQQLSRAASASPSAAAYFQLGQLQQGAEHVNDARASYQQALKLNPKSVEVQRALDSVNGIRR
ncbi:MAG: tetratricopeptide repeat protein [Candidatus Sulfotelmatobacter sp.]